MKEVDRMRVIACVCVCMWVRIRPTYEQRMRVGLLADAAQISLAANGAAAAAVAAAAAAVAATDYGVAQVVRKRRKSCAH